MIDTKIDTATIEAFLSGHRFAVVGASDDRRNFGNTVYRAMKDHGYDVVPVHQSAMQVEGDRCYADLHDVPGDLDGVVVMVGPARAAEVVRACADRGVRQVWLFKGIGAPGAVTEEALEVCRERGIDVVAGACPMMFLEPVSLFHKVHRGIRRLKGSLEVAS